MSDNINKLLKKELIEIAGKHQIKNRWKMNKTELIQAINESKSESKSKSKNESKTTIDSKDSEKTSKKTLTNSVARHKDNFLVGKYFKKQQLGSKGKEGLTYLVIDTETKKQYAMKTFKSSKSSNKIKKEVEYQELAYEYDVAPKIVDYDLEQKYIVMKLLDRTLLDIIKEQNSYLTNDQQNSIIQLFKNLDKAGIIHNDCNPLNIMERKDQFYMIDYGFTTETKPSHIKEFGETPNLKMMPIGLLIWMKKLKVPTDTWNVIRSYVDSHYLKQLEL